MFKNMQMQTYSSQHSFRFGNHFLERHQVALDESHAVPDVVVRFRNFAATDSRIETLFNFFDDGLAYLDYTDIDELK